jgi:hypothetical protein
MTPHGAPKGNTNALKHGFYSKRFRRQDINDLDALSESELPSLGSELALLRVALSRTFEQLSNDEEVRWIDNLSEIGLAATRIASILRTQKYLDGDQGDEIKDALRLAIDITAKKWKTE